MSGIYCIQTGMFACWHCSHFVHFLVVDKASVYRGWVQESMMLQYQYKLSVPFASRQMGEAFLASCCVSIMLLGKHYPCPSKYCVEALRLVLQGRTSSWVLHLPAVPL